MSDNDNKASAIDPRGCGCTECIVGEYVPAEDATREHLRRLAVGDMTNNTYQPGTVLLRPPHPAEEHGGNLVYEVSLPAESMTEVFTPEELNDLNAETIFYNLRA